MVQGGFSSQANTPNSHLKEMNKLVKRILGRDGDWGSGRGNSQFKSPGARLCLEEKQQQGGGGGWREDVRVERLLRRVLWVTVRTLVFMPSVVGAMEDSEQKRNVT